MVAQLAKGSSWEEMSASNRAFLDARDALAALRKPRQKTEAEQKLDEVLQNLKSKKSDAAKEAARRKMEQLKAKLQALKLAAGSAAATGDPKLARKVAQDIRDAVRQLSKAMSEAGAGSGSAPVAAAGSTPVAADSEKSASDQAGQQMKAMASGDDLASLKSEAASLAKELKKIMRKLRETSLHPGLDKKDHIEMEKMFSEAEREISGLEAASAPGMGAAVDVSV